MCFKVFIHTVEEICRVAQCFDTAKETFYKIPAETSKTGRCTRKQLGPCYVRLQVEHWFSMPTLPFVFAYPWSVCNALYHKHYRVACFPYGFHSLFMACISEVHSIHLQMEGLSLTFQEARRTEE